MEIRAERTSIGAWGASEWYALALGGAAVAFAVALGKAGHAIAAPAAVLIPLCGVALLAEKQCVRLAPHTESSVSALPLLFAAVVYGPVDAIVVGVAALLGELGRPVTRWAVWTFSRMLVGGLAGLAAIAIVPGTDEFAAFVPAVAVVVVIEGLGEGALALLTAAVRRNGPPLRETARTVSRVLVATIPVFTVIVGVLAYTYLEFSRWTVLLFFIPAVGAHRLLVLYQEQRRLTEDVLSANDRLRSASLSFASALVAALDARDRYTAGHSAAVAIYARDIAQRLGFSREEQELAHLAGLLHDVGKVGVPAGILEKEGALSPEERREMQEHSEIGERILANVDGYEAIATIVRHHHERVDGGGYPDGLMGDEIPLIARIICVADAYNAMTSERPYRGALTDAVARARLRENVGAQFDAAVVEAFDAILDEAPELYRTGARADFALQLHQHPAPDPALAAAAA